jgi:hypothetical protein
MVHMKTLELASVSFADQYAVGSSEEWDRLRDCLPNLAELKISEFSSIEKFISNSALERSWESRRLASRFYENTLPLFNVKKLTVELAQISPLSICLMLEKMSAGRGRLREAVVSSGALYMDPFFARNENSPKLKGFNEWVESVNGESGCSVRVTWAKSQPNSRRVWRVLTVDCRFPGE